MGSCLSWDKALSHSGLFPLHPSHCISCFLLPSRGQSPGSSSKATLNMSLYLLFPQHRSPHPPLLPDQIPFFLQDSVLGVPPGAPELSAHLPTPHSSPILIMEGEEQISHHSLPISLHARTRTGQSKPRCVPAFALARQAGSTGQLPHSIQCIPPSPPLGGSCVLTLNIPSLFHSPTPLQAI